LRSNSLFNAFFPSPCPPDRLSARPPVRLSVRPSVPHSHLPHPHWAQLIQPEARTTGPAQSGQTRMRCETSPGPSVRPSAFPPVVGWYVVGCAALERTWGPLVRPVGALSQLPCSIEGGVEREWSAMEPPVFGIYSVPETEYNPKKEGVKNLGNEKTTLADPCLAIVRRVYNVVTRVTSDTRERPRLPHREEP
jgi:hypothetical protein